VAGTVAADVLDEFRLIAKPDAGAGAERFKMRFCVEDAVIGPEGWLKEMVSAT
jgi:hypothetical protein